MNINVAIVCCIVFVFVGCSIADREERQLASLLENEFEDECIFTHPQYTMLLGKPEFAELEDKKLCNVNVTVENRHTVSDAETQVTFRVYKKARKRNLNRFLDAWNKMEERLVAIEPRKIPDPALGVVYSYYDPFDNALFFGRIDDEKGIRGTREWHYLSMYKDDVLKLLENGTVSSPVISGIIIEDNDEVEIFVDQNYAR